MRYILMMTGSKAGVDAYRAWTDEQRQAHMASLTRTMRELRESGEFVSTAPLAGPGEAKLVRGQIDGVPITDGVFPESKEFLLGYWIVDVNTAERACLITNRRTRWRK